MAFLLTPVGGSAPLLRHHSVTGGAAKLLLWQRCPPVGARGRAPRALRQKAAAAGAEAAGLDAASVLKFERDGFVYLPSVLGSDPGEAQRWSQGILEAARAEEEAALRQNVRVLLGEEYVKDDLGFELEADELSELLEMNGVEVPFLQCFNLWRKGCDSAQRLAFHPGLTSAAAELLGCHVNEIRLYQDSTFLKRPGDGPTRFHVDLNMAPLDTNRHLTFWIPLQDVPSQQEGGTGLTYARGSHRDVSLHFWGVASDDLSSRYDFETAGAINLGDAVAHHGWCLHGAPDMEDDSAGPRGAHAVSYFVDGARVLPPIGSGRGGEIFEEDQESYQEWLSAVGAGGLARHALVPLVVEGKAS